MKKRILISILAALGLALFAAFINRRNNGILYSEIEDENAKFHEFYYLLLNWLHIKNQHKDIGVYLKECGYSSVAVYGLKEIGKELIDELNKSGIEVKCAIDKDTNAYTKGVTVIKPEDDIPEVDVVIVTAIHYFDEIKEWLEKKKCCPILALDDLIWEISRKVG